MDLNTVKIINMLNPWLESRSYTDLLAENYTNRIQEQTILLPEWNTLCTILIGPRRAGKTTLGKALCHILLTKKKTYSNLVYLNCDLKEIRQLTGDILFVRELLDAFSLKKPIIFLDEVQRLESPGLLLKAIVDLNLSIKLIATGSAQIELKSKIKEHLTGRKFESLVLPLSQQEIPDYDIETWLIYGSYPQVVTSKQKRLVLEQLYSDYIKKDILEILKVGNPDVLEKIIILLAHSSGQLVNEQQLSIDCKVSNSMIRHYLSVLVNTYVIYKITPFCGNKRVEITSRPKYYFIDNGFRNTALNNYLTTERRTDVGFLVESVIFQEILKFKTQNYLNFNINFWRTKSGAEMDFVLSTGTTLLAIEVKYQNIKKFTLSKSFHSFLKAYNPKAAIVITKNFLASESIDGCIVYMLPLSRLDKLFNLMLHWMHKP